MFKKSIIVLKIAVVVMGLIVLALSIFALPELWKGGSVEFPEASTALLLIMLGLYATTIPFFIGLWQTLKLLHYISKDLAFSDPAVNALRKIKYCAIVIGILYLGGLPLLLPIAQADDAPGLMIVGLFVACIPIVVAAFAEVLQKLWQSR